VKAHADGVYMEKIGLLAGFYPIDEKIVHSRKFPNSCTQPT